MTGVEDCVDVEPPVFGGCPEGDVVAVLDPGAAADAPRSLSLRLPWPSVSDNSHAFKFLHSSALDLRGGIGRWLCQLDGDAGVDPWRGAGAQGR